MRLVYMDLPSKFHSKRFTNERDNERKNTPALKSVPTSYSKGTSEPQIMKIGGCMHIVYTDPPSKLYNDRLWNEWDSERTNPPALKSVPTRYSKGTSEPNSMKIGGCILSVYEDSPMKFGSIRFTNERDTEWKKRPALNSAPVICNGEISQLNIKIVGGYINIVYTNTLLKFHDERVRNEWDNENKFPDRWTRNELTILRVVSEP